MGPCSPPAVSAQWSERLANKAQSIARVPVSESFPDVDDVEIVRMTAINF